MTTSPETRRRLEAVARDNGFDLPVEATPPWLGFRSSQAPVGIWLAADEWRKVHLAVSAERVGQELVGFAEKAPWPLPAGAAGLWNHRDSVAEAIQQVFRLACVQPDLLLQTFAGRAARLPRETEAERYLVQQVGQEVFRDALLQLWQGQCPITGIAEPELLQACHIKPWQECSDDAERLDVCNGFLLAPQLAVAFQRGFITFATGGTLICSNKLSETDIEALGIVLHRQRIPLFASQRRYLKWHWKNVYKGPIRRGTSGHLLEVTITHPLLARFYDELATNKHLADLVDEMSHPEAVHLIDEAWGGGALVPTWMNRLSTVTVAPEMSKLELFNSGFESATCRSSWERNKPRHRRDPGVSDEEARAAELFCAADALQWMYEVVTECMQDEAVGNFL